MFATTVRIALASLVLLASTAVPALAAVPAGPSAGATPNLPGGLCQRWPRLCGL